MRTVHIYWLLDVDIILLTHAGRSW